MLHQRTAIFCVALVAALSVLPAGGSAKQTDHNGGVRQCQQRVADKIGIDHPASRGMSFDSGVQRNPFGNNAVTISGRGHVRTAQGKKRGVTYSCVYNIRSGKLSKVKYSVR